MEIIINLLNNEYIHVLFIVIVLDTIFGILRAIKEKELNSCIGIDGLIRKVGMIISVFFLFLIDSIIEFNLLFFIPENLKQIMNIGTVGIGDLFNFLFIIFEILSVLKNMVRCKLPIPKKFQNFLEKIMSEFTTEIKVKEGEKNE